MPIWTPVPAAGDGTSHMDRAAVGAQSEALSSFCSWFVAPMAPIVRLVFLPSVFG
jgi:hypothetical protein